MSDTTWRGTLRAAAGATSADFVAKLRALDGSGWEHADTAELQGLAAWGEALAKHDRAAGIGALVRVAQLGFPRAVEAAGDEISELSFLESEELYMDGLPVETQLARAAAWLDSPDDEHRAAVEEAFDPSRQLQIWDEDLRPTDDTRAYRWFTEVGQCACAAILRDDGDVSRDTYYDWPPEVCVGRGLVVALRGLRGPGADLEKLFADAHAALVA